MSGRAFWEADEPVGRWSDAPTEPVSAADRPVWKLSVRAEPGVHDIRALRALLKRLLRTFGFRCVDISREPPL
jgi:hypothetical protein